MKHDRRELLARIHELRATPLEAAFLDVALTCRLRDEELCEVVQEVLEFAAKSRDAHAAKIAEQNSVYDPRD